MSPSGTSVAEVNAGRSEIDAQKAGDSFCFLQENSERVSVNTKITITNILFAFIVRFYHIRRKKTLKIS